MEMTIHPHGYWIGHDPKEHRFDIQLAKSILYIVQMSLPTMVDIGCGDGSYVRFFLEYNLTCHGYDGNPETERITEGLCKVKDFSKNVDIGLYDTVLSLEVGEHIPEIFEDVFISNIVNAAKSMIIMSWGIPGQGGFGHVNCRDNQYVVDKIETKGFKYMQYLSTYLRGNSTLSWFKNTILVFTHE